MKSSAKNVKLASVDDLFTTEESRANDSREKVVEIPLAELHPFKDHPFKVKDDDAMMDTAESIKQYGVLVPAIARPDPDGGYELVAGHRRYHASELAGKDTMPVIIRDLDDDAATIIMVDSNLQREELLPSERAFAYSGTVSVSDAATKVVAVGGNGVEYSCGVASDKSTISYTGGLLVAKGSLLATTRLAMNKSVTFDSQLTSGTNYVSTGAYTGNYYVLSPGTTAAPTYLVKIGLVNSQTPTTPDHLVWSGDESKDLTLKNTVIIGLSTDASGLTMTWGGTLALDGFNVVLGPDSPKLSSWGVRLLHNLITGSGTLVTIAGNSNHASGISRGLEIDINALTQQVSANIVAIGGYSPTLSNGVSANGKFAVTGGTGVAIAGSSAGSARAFSNTPRATLVAGAWDGTVAAWAAGTPGAAPTTASATVAKTEEIQESVEFTLTNSPAYADGQTWNVYTSETGDTPAAGVRLTNVGNVLTLADYDHDPADLQPGEYYVSVLETGKLESTRLKLTVGAYAPYTPPTAASAYSVTDNTAADANGSLTLSKTTAYAGDTVKITPTANDGYELDTLTVKDANGKEIAVTKNADGTYSFKMPAANVTVTAAFKTSETPWVNPFGDVKESDWFYAGVAYANQNGLFNGTGADTFSPEADMTRQQMWMVLARMAGENPANMDEAQAWAVKNEISDGSNPTSNVTREQFVTLLWRAAGSPKATGDLSGYADFDAVADYAIDAMRWAVENGIISGTTATTLSPASSASRAQIAVILSRYLNK